MAYKMVWRGQMEKPTGQKVCSCDLIPAGTDGNFKTRAALVSFAHDTVGWRAGCFYRIYAYRLRVTPQEWEKAIG